MSTQPIPSDFWRRWLQTACVAIMVYGLCLMAAPKAMLGMFSMVYYSSASALSAGDSLARDYILLIQGVLGSVVFGWGLMMLLIARGPLRRGSIEIWRIMAVGLFSWFASEAVFSIAMGSMVNLILGLIFGVMFLPPIVAIYRQLNFPRGE